MCIPACIVVNTPEVAALEMFGEYSRVLNAGCTFYCWPICDVVETDTLAVQLLNVRFETKTVDNVFVKVDVDVAFQLELDQIRKAFYVLNEREFQMQSFVKDSLRSCVCTMTLDGLYAGKDVVSIYVIHNLTPEFEKFGVKIVSVNVKDVIPDARVANAMNEINSSKRLKEAAVQRAEGDKVIRVKQAEAEAERRFDE